MTFFCPSRITNNWALLLNRSSAQLYVLAWTAFVVTTVSIVSLAPEVAFVWALSPASPFTHHCGGANFVRLPLDALPNEIICIPTELFGSTSLDLIVPPIFSAVVVASSACIVRMIGLWEGGDGDEDLD
ncbi:hypothetical protein KSP40_PGU021057 [Platanthera guangdongensis]|uniref:Uncharacterized protein n=1 Tax=Platanthera guangdongensis TaxID=2320717 RepID=A0ABR2M777_9ASPA